MFVYSLLFITINIYQLCVFLAMKNLSIYLLTIAVIADTRHPSTAPQAQAIAGGIWEMFTCCATPPSLLGRAWHNLKREKNWTNHSFLTIYNTFVNSIFPTVTLVVANKFLFQTWKQDSFSNDGNS